MQFERTPAALGFFMPAEWGPHERCWMSWPCRPEPWDGPEGLLRARIAYARVARAIVPFEPVVVVARPEDAREAELACGRDVEIMPLPLNDSWIRDNGPVFVVDGNGPQTRTVAGLDWEFNAWGHAYHGFEADDALPEALLSHLKMRRFAGPMVLEGGSYLVDGLGTLLTTEECLLNPNRNPSLTREQIEERLAFFLGVQRIIWLPQGFEDDETDGHIDNIAAFVAPGRVALNMPTEVSDPNWPVMQAARETLMEARDASGNALEIVEVPQPARQMGHRGRLPKSYLNFYLANGAVIVPAFDDPLDGDAAGLFRDLFPDREVVQVAATDIVEGGGGIHCITQQQPKGTVAPDSDAPQ